MRTGLFVAGILFLVFAVFGWLFLVIFPPLACALIILAPLLFILGIVLLILGAVLESPQPAYPYAIPVMPVPYAPAATHPCPTCGGPMTWTAPPGRWFCPSCNAYR